MFACLLFCFAPWFCWKAGQCWFVLLGTGKPWQTTGRTEKGHAEVTPTPSLPKTIVNSPIAICQNNAIMYQYDKDWGNMPEQQRMTINTEFFFKAFQYDKPGCGCMIVKYANGKPDEYRLCDRHKKMVKALLNAPDGKRQRNLANTRRYNKTTRAPDGQIIEGLKAIIPNPYTLSSVIRSSDNQKQRIALRKYFHSILGKDQNHFGTLKPARVLFECIQDMPITIHQFAKESGVSYTWLFTLKDKDAVQVVKLAMLAKAFVAHNKDKSELRKFREATYDLLGIGNTREDM